MEYNKDIGSWQKGDQIEGFYILKDASLKQTAAGKSFLSGVVCDASGSMDMKVWDYNGSVNAADKGTVIKVRGEVSDYKGALQFTGHKIRTAEETDNYDLSRLVPVAPIDKEERLQEIRKLIDSMDDPDYQKLAGVMLDRHLECFSRIPAGKSVHHSFISGLLMHTSNMLRIADFLSVQYSNVIDRNLLLTGTLLHDFAKESEFVRSELGLVIDYSVKGQLLGHLVMGAQEVAEIAKELEIPDHKSVLVQHLILSHHGQPEFGAAVLPCCAESELLSEIDVIDSRMEIYAEAYNTMEPGTFSSRIYALDKKVFLHE